MVKAKSRGKRILTQHASCSNNVAGTHLQKKNLGKNLFQYCTYNAYWGHNDKFFHVILPDKVISS